MITPKAFEIFDVLIDEFGTGEVSRADKTIWLNQAIRDYIQDRISPKNRNKGYSFQIDNLARTEMKDLYIAPIALNLASAGLFDYPANFSYPGTLLVTINGKVVGCNIVSPSKAEDLRDDPFIDKSFEPFAELTASGIVVTSKETDGSDLTAATFSYVKQWTETTWGTTLLAGSIDETVGNIIYVESGNLTYNGSTYNVGETFTIVISGGNISNSGSGAVITNTEISDDVMRECIRKASYQYLVAMDQLPQANAMMIQEMNG